MVATALALVIGLGGGYVIGSAQQSAPMTHDMSTVMEGMTSELEGKTGTEFERAFIDGMVAHHQGAVAMAEMVLQQSQRPELIKLANDIISAQTSEIGMMSEWRTQWFEHHTQ